MTRRTNLPAPLAALLAFFGLDAGEIRNSFRRRFRRRRDPLRYLRRDESHRRYRSALTAGLVTAWRKRRIGELKAEARKAATEKADAPVTRARWKKLMAKMARVRIPAGELRQACLEIFSGRSRSNVVVVS